MGDRLAKIDYEPWIIEGRRLLAEVGSVERVIDFLRKEGASYFDSIWVLMELKDISLRDATSLVYNSETWADDRQEILESQPPLELFSKAVEELKRRGVRKRPSK